MLEKSREFFRDHENTVYHVGYPDSYRQTGKEPNLQMSLSEDGLRADIDVDYRSSRSPRSLFNGHLTASNSDIRVGENPNLHSGRWGGLITWWQDTFGRLVRAISRAAGSARPRPARCAVHTAPPDRPSGATPDRIEDAAQELLTDWLVRRQYSQALEVLSPRSLRVSELSRTREGPGRSMPPARGVSCSGSWNTRMTSSDHGRI